MNTSSSTSRAKVAAAVAATSLALVTFSGAFSPAAAATDSDLVLNGSFTSGATGWRTNATTQKLAVSGGFAHLTTTTQQSAALNDTANTVAAAPAQTRYLVSAKVRTTAPEVVGQLRVREVGSAATIVHRTDYKLSTSDWTTVELEVITTLDGASLDLNVVAGALAPTKSLDIDDVTMVVDPYYRPGWVLTENVDLSSPTGWTLDSGTASNTASQDRPANVTFSSAGMTIVGTRGGATNGSAFTSGDAKGLGHPIPNYARVEVVGRGPAAKGLWPCVLWLRPLLGNDGEIDLVENFGGQAYAKATLHNEYGATHKMIGQSLAWAKLANPDPAALHTYVMEKTPNRIQVWVDGIQVMDASPATAPAGFDWTRIFENPAQTWYPRVTLQIGCGTANPTCATGMPASTFTKTDMQVTELRIYAPAS